MSNFVRFHVSPVVNLVTQRDLAAAFQSSVQDACVDAKNKREQGKETCDAKGRVLKCICLGGVVVCRDGCLFCGWKDTVDIVASRSINSGTIVEVSFASPEGISVCIFAIIIGSVIAVITSKTVTLDNGALRVRERSTIQTFVNIILGKNGTSSVEEDSQFHRRSIRRAIRPQVVPAKERK
jgi:hypothetical protein